MRRHDWEEARELFLEAERNMPLAPADLEQLGDAGWWTGHPDERTDALERAYAGYVDAGERTAAAGVALLLFDSAIQRLSAPVAVGWLRRAERMLEGEPPSQVHAIQALFRAFRTLVQGDFDAGFAQAEQALALARQHNDRDVEALALNLMGSALVKKGDVAGGLALVDESTTAAVGGELNAWTTANVYCGTMGICRDLSDWQRAGEWTEEADREMRRQRINGFPGVCRVHRAEVKRLRGDWAAAEAEARQACVDLEQFHLMGDLGWGFNELGEIRRQMGDVAGAEEAYQRAHEYGRDPEPGLALLRLAQGDQEGAAAAIKRALSVKDRPRFMSGDSPGEPLGRSHLLPSQVEIALAVGDLETADAAATELEAITGAFGSTALQASAASARGAVILAQGDHAAALEPLLRGRHLWQVVGAPYEVARVRMQLAAAYLSVGEDTNGLMELEAARSTFERLGAAPDLRTAEAELERLGATRHVRAGPRVTRTFMFTDIVTSTELLEAMGDEAWEGLIGWHDAALRGVIAKHGGQEVSHTGDGFFVAFGAARDAIDAAVDVQRTLVAHRKEHGFAPWVRIGLHTAEVSQVEANYRGVGVHVAARVSSLADREQILASAATLDSAGPLPYPASGPRTVNLKGIKQPLVVSAIGWAPS